CIDFLSVYFFFCFDESGTTYIYSLSLHDALPILGMSIEGISGGILATIAIFLPAFLLLFGILPFWDNIKSNIYAEGKIPNSKRKDRKSTRLNSSHVSISYAVFCLKKKNTLIKINN